MVSIGYWRAWGRPGPKWGQVGGCGAKGRRLTCSSNTTADCVLGMLTILKAG